MSFQCCITVLYFTCSYAVINNSSSTSGSRGSSTSTTSSISTGGSAHVCSRVYTPVSFSSTISCDDVTGKKTILTSESDG